LDQVERRELILVFKTLASLRFTKGNWFQNRYLEESVMSDGIGFPGNCQTTAMGIMPHRDIGRALELSLSLDIPYWPQLPNISYYEDMYVQASQHFPGVVVDVENQKLWFDSDRFNRELGDFSERMARPETFTLSEDYSCVYHRFLARDLSKYPAIRGQLIGPVSFGFKVVDENKRPIIYNEPVRALLLDFIQRKVNAQQRELKEKNPNAFVWLDEPGLGWVFSGLSGYDDLQAKREYRDFWGGLTGPGALHLCANINLPYLLGLGVRIISFDAYQIDVMPRGYAAAVARFVLDGGIISWGIVPTDSATLRLETPDKLAERLCGYWQVVADNSEVTVKDIAARALLAPARCCLKNIGEVGAADEKVSAKNQEACHRSLEEEVVERAFDDLKTLSRLLRQRFGR